MARRLHLPARTELKSENCTLPMAPIKLLPGNAASNSIEPRGIEQVAPSGSTFAISGGFASFHYRLESRRERVLVNGVHRLTAVPVFPSQFCDNPKQSFPPSDRGPDFSVELDLDETVYVCTASSSSFVAAPFPNSDPAGTVAPGYVNAAVRMPALSTGGALPRQTPENSQINLHYLIQKDDFRSKLCPRRARDLASSIAAIETNCKREVKRSRSADDERDEAACHGHSAETQRQSNNRRSLCSSTSLPHIHAFKYRRPDDSSRLPCGHRQTEDERLISSTSVDHAADLDSKEVHRNGSNCSDSRLFESARHGDHGDLDTHSSYHRRLHGICSLKLTSRSAFEQPHAQLNSSVPKRFCYDPGYDLPYSSKESKVRFPDHLWGAGTYIWVRTTANRTLWILRYWHFYLRLDNPTCPTIAFQTFYRALRKLRRRLLYISASRIRILLAAAFWAAAKLVDTAEKIPAASDMARTAGVTAPSLIEAALLCWTP